MILRVGFKLEVETKLRLYDNVVETKYVDSAKLFSLLCPYMGMFMSMLKCKKKTLNLLKSFLIAEFVAVCHSSFILVLI